MKENKQKIIYITFIVLAFFIGVSGTVMIFHYFPVTEEVNGTKENITIKEENTIKSAVNKVYDSVVLVKSYKRGQIIGTGTGFVYKKDVKYGYIITNHHVVDGADEVKIKNNAGTEVTTKVLGSDEYSDIAVLSIDKESVMSVASVGKSSESEIGDTIFTVGSPLGEEYMGTVTKGIISGKDRTIEVDNSGLMEVIQIDAAINPGNSGGPLVNINGEVIGVNSIKLVKDEVEGMGFAIPIELAMTTASKLEKGESIKRPLVGIEMTDVQNTYLLYKSGIEIDESIEEGVVVVTVQDGSPAKSAGIESGDVIVEFGDKKVTSLATFRHALYQYSVGDKVKIKYFRGKNLKETTIHLTKEA